MIVVACLSCLLRAHTLDGRQAQPEYALLAGQIAGHVYRADTHGGLGKVIVVLNPQDGSPAQRRVIMTDASGAFAFPDLEAGQYTLSAERTGFVTQYGAERNHSPSGSVLLHAGEQINDLSFSLIQAGSVVGTVKDEDNDPVSGLRVLALKPKYLEGGKLQLSAVASEITDDRGLFRFHGLMPGRFYLRVGGILQFPMGELPPMQSAGHGEQYRDAWFPEIAAVDGSSASLRVTPGSDTNVGVIEVQRETTWTLKGKVNGLETADHKPTEVSCVRDQPFEETVSWSAHSVAIQADGTFVIQGLTSGEYTATATSVSNESQIRAGYASVQIADRNVKTTIHLGEAASVSGRVVGNGSELSAYKDLKVTVEPTNQQGFYVSDIDSADYFKVQNIPPGTYTLGLVKWKEGGVRPYPKEISCAGRDYGRAAFSLAIGSALTACEIILADDLSTVSGVVKNGDKLQSNLTIVLIPQSRALRLLRRYTVTANTDHLGRYEITNVIPGDYLLFAVQPDPEQLWFALNFADNPAAEGTKITVASGQAQHSDLTVF